MDVVSSKMNHITGSVDALEASLKQSMGMLEETIKDTIVDFMVKGINAQLVSIEGACTACLNAVNEAISCIPPSLLLHSVVDHDDTTTPNVKRGNHWLHKGHRECCSAG